MRFEIRTLTDPVAVSTAVSTAGAATGCGDCLRWSSDRSSPWLGELLPKPSTIGLVANEVSAPNPSVAGYAVAAAPTDVPAMASFVSGPVSDDSLLLVTGRVYGQYAGAGVGERLIHGLVKQALKREVRALEAYGDSARHVPGHTCLLPTGFLQAVGFSVVRRHPTYPRLRLDLRSIATWPSDVAQAADRLFGVLADLRLPGRVPGSAVGRTTGAGRVGT